MAQGHFRLALERQAQGFGGDEGVAVAVATDPVAHAQEGRDVLARQRGFELRVQARDLDEEGAGVVAQHVFDFIGHGELGVAQHARLPQLGDAGAQRVLDLLLGDGVGAHALAQQLTNVALGIEDGLALHLGGVGGEHRRQVGLVEQATDVFGTVAGVDQALEAAGQRAGQGF